MDVKERLIELIACADFHPCKGIVRTIGSSFSAEFIEDIASHLIAHGITIEAEPVRHGRWDECDWVEYDGHSECIHYPKEALRCSNCCNAFKKKLLWKRNFCPNCGARMDLEVSNEND